MRTTVETFLAHHGIRGMKWGVRRKRGPDGTVSSAANGSKSSASGDTNLSSDAQKIADNAGKSTSELSTKDLQDAVNRANVVKQYNQLFQQDRNAELRQKVEALNLQRDLAKAKADMTPNKLDRVNRFLKTAGLTFDTYAKLNKASEGKLNDNIARKLDELRGVKNQQDQVDKMVQDIISKAAKDVAKKK